MKKKGVTLLEVMVALGILSILLVGISLLSTGRHKAYEEELGESRAYFYTHEAMMFLENELNEETQKIAVTSQGITFYKVDGFKINAIQRIENKLVILYGNKYSPPKETSYKNTIVEDIEDFQIKEKGKLLYITIKPKGRKKYSRCLVFKKEL